MARQRSAGALSLEGLVIVLSILAAFAIDAWWDGRQEQEREQIVLEGILEEFRDSEAELSR